mmetsp:Transcript_44981/g.79178  ORF Transcript_44981/g.79178 Transcript_44981/m.79178 type:complete len:218 (+) Transcript_44981:1407-2060(+)
MKPQLLEIQCAILWSCVQCIESCVQYCVLISIQGQANPFGNGREEHLCACTLSLQPRLSYLHQFVQALPHFFSVFVTPITARGFCVLILPPCFGDLRELSGQVPADELGEQLLGLADLVRKDCVERHQEQTERLTCARGELLQHLCDMINCLLRNIRTDKWVDFRSTASEICHRRQSCVAIILVRLHRAAMKAAEHDGQDQILQHLLALHCFLFNPE